MSELLADIFARVDARRAEYTAQRPRQSHESRLATSGARKRHKTAPRPRPSACEVCGGHGGRHGIVFDHCHRSGSFRGWLCSACNTTLGAVRDDPDVLLKLAAYLRTASQG